MHYTREAATMSSNMLLTLLGQHQAISLAELKAIYGTKNVTRFSDEFALINATELYPHLGGVLKVAQVLEELPKTDPSSIAKHLENSLPKYLNDSTSKITFGLSFYGPKLNTKFVRTLSLNLKRKLKQAGKSVRIVPNNSPALSSAQVLHNKLTTKGSEIMVVVGSSRTIVTKTIYVQDISAYSQRDYGRPARDARVGMLPPKLAQIMINLAVGSQQSGVRSQ